MGNSDGQNTGSAICSKYRDSLTCKYKDYVIYNLVNLYVKLRNTYCYDKLIFNKMYNIKMIIRQMNNSFP
jgi:hypothetical protein